MITIILGARSGTSLMRACLIAAGKTPWGDLDHTREAPIFREIRARYPVILNNWFPSNPTWDLAKLPEFAFCIPTLIRKYHPQFIVMDRPISEMVRSALKLKWGKYFRIYCDLNQNFTYEIKNHLGYHPQSDRDFTWGYYQLMKYHTRKALACYDDDRKLRIQFKTFMGEYLPTLKRVCEFTGQEYKPGTFQSLRSQAWSLCYHPPESYTKN